MSSGWEKNSGESSWIVAGTLAYYLWIKPSQDLKRQQEERAALASSDPYRYIEKRKPIPDPQETGLIYGKKNRNRQIRGIICYKNRVLILLTVNDLDKMLRDSNPVSLKGCIIKCGYKKRLLVSVRLRVISALVKPVVRSLKPVKISNKSGFGPPPIERKVRTGDGTLPHDILRHGVAPDKISSQLSPWTSALFEFLPPYIKKQLLLHPESDDSAQLSQIETEKLLAHLVETENEQAAERRHIHGEKVQCYLPHFLARGSLPSKFDCDYAYVLGHISYHILAAGLNGYMATVTNLKNPCNDDSEALGSKPLAAETECRKVRNIVKPGCSQEVLKAALSVMASVTDVLSVMSSTSSNGQTPL
ncbi:LOW QUALITY PROTEIN: hypothetical protein NC653_015026 [Populus alba x Populus x berolinensis]|uniref:Uncharacterized protein n=1 Tax=Populus alba x Populus x berolinensis TaxID=444605 RepID=A0AAD6W4M1_9ROSI|nr:LOW QUALITY PROTEIN: hypothetical protein NC653_015026 [Populus alba x Populus x berolinensis]